MMNAEYRNASDPHNHQYVGYIAELMQRVSQLVGFTYVIRSVQDGGYGYLRQDGTWDGIVGEIVNGVRSDSPTNDLQALTALDVISFAIR